MDPISEIIAALTAGDDPPPGSRELDAVQEAQAELQSQLREALADHQKAMAALEGFERTPGTFEAEFRSELAESGVQFDPSVLGTARTVLWLDDPEDHPAPAGFPGGEPSGALAGSAAFGYAESDPVIDPPGVTRTSAYATDDTVVDPPDRG